jgi:hypothetical protein
MPDTTGVRSRTQQSRAADTKTTESKDTDTKTTQTTAAEPKSTEPTTTDTKPSADPFAALTVSPPRSDKPHPRMVKFVEEDRAAREAALTKETKQQLSHIQLPDPSLYAEVEHALHIAAAACNMSVKCARITEPPTDENDSEEKRNAAKLVAIGFRTTNRRGRTTPRSE